MKSRCIPVAFAMMSVSALAADVYEFGQAQGGTETVRVQKEAGFKAVAATQKSAEQEEAVPEEPTLREDTGGLPGCEQSTRVGGYAVKAENNCSEEGKPLIRFGK